MGHDDRLKLANDIARRFQIHYGADVLAIGVYGSLARGTDTDFSDIEMYCILKGTQIDTPCEWSNGNWKAEVDVQSADVLLKWASELDETWSLTHGSCVNILSLYDPEAFFSQLKSAVFDHRDEQFEAVIKEMIIGELYEFAGKIRNTIASGNTSSLPLQVANITKYTAFMIGLANRSLFTSSASFLPESLAMKDRPSGYDELCDVVMSGQLSDFEHLRQLVNNLWAGVEAWAAHRGLKIHENLDELLKSKG